PLFFVIGVLFQRLLISRLRPRTLEMMSVLLTFAVALIVEGLLGFAYSGTQRRINLPYSGSSLEVAGIHIPIVKLMAFALAAVAMVALFLILKRTSFGQALRATIQHPEAARL